MKTLREHQHLVWLGLAIAILLAEALVFRESWRHLTESRDYFEQARLTVRRLQSVLSLLKDAELAQRGYIITGGEDYLAPFDAARSDLPPELRKLRRMADTPAQAERFSLLEDLVTRRLDLLSAAIDARRERGFHAAAAVVGSSPGRSVTDGVRVLAAEIERDQAELLERHTLEAEAAGRLTVVVCTAGSGVLLVLMAAGALLIHRDNRRRDVLLDLTRQQSGIIQFAHEAIVVRDPAGHIMSWNTGAAELYGWSAAEAVGRHLHTLLWSRLPVPEPELNAVLERDGRWYGEIEQRNRHGRELVVETRQVLVRDAHGAPMGVLEMIRDITGHRHVEDALRKSRERLEMVVRSIQLGLFYCDLPFDRFSWDDTCKQHHGLAPGEEANVDLFYARMHPPDREPTRQAIGRSIRDGQPCDVVYRVEPPGAAPRWVRVIGKAFYDPSGKPVRFDGVTMDVTAQRRAEEQLNESRERLRAALSASGTGTFRWHMASGAIDLDEQLPHIFRLPPEIAPQTFGTALDLVHPEDRAMVAAVAARAARETGEVELEFRLAPSGWPPQWVAVEAKTFPGPSGEPLYMTGACLNITERKRHEEEIRQTQKLESIGLLAGGIAHDFNNLLVGIMGNASLAAEVLPPGASERRILDEVVRSSECAADLTRQLLAYAGKGRFFVEPVNLSGLIRETAGLVQSSLPKKIKLELQLGEVPPVEADRVQMQQVMMNLVINAGEAIGEAQAGVVRVSTALRRVDAASTRGFVPPDIPPGPYVELEIQDTGCGMDEATLARIFDPFFTTKFTGRGLGLAAVQGIVRGHKGALRVSSSPGSGTVFKLLFPAAGAALRPASGPASAADLQGSGLVLVIDDEPVVRQTARTALERYGYSVLAAEDGARAVALFRSRAAEVGLVLLDLTMPVMAGEETLEQIQRIRADVPVLLSSGFDQAEAVQRFAGRGLAGFVQKPYTAAQLACAVKAAMAPRSAAAQA